ncbi:MAG: prolyl oligopeptidase family serine peptidase [Xanthomonadaceae bacterium]|nr:prolyl oligopeptidase family serine peptidase [Xanthomonadaceae bacterium]
MRLILILWLLLIGMTDTCADVAYSALAKHWTPDALHVPYRSIETPGRINGEKLPLIVFLHGDWQDGTNNESQLAGYGNGSMLWLDQAIHGNIPLVYVAPQTTGAYWPPRRVAAVVRDALKRFPIDPRRIYLTGVSDGGTGVWDAFKTWPECFAAGVPMSGMTEIAGLASIRDVPEWAFHGAKDNDTDVETGYGGAMVGSRAVVRALRALGARPRYTEYPNEMHVIWHHAYSTPALLPWLLDQRLQHPPCDFDDLPAPGSLTWKGGKR